MTITIFGRAIGGPAMTRSPVTNGGPASKKSSPNSTPVKNQNRKGVSPHGSANSQSDVFQFTDTLAGSNSKTYALSADDDYTAAVFAVTVTPTGNTAAGTDILTAFSQLQFIAPDGPIITLQPAPDFYMWQQRFGEFGNKPTVVNTTANANPASGTYYVSGFNLPLGRGPYTLIVNIVAPASFTASTTALSVQVTLSLKIGTAAYRSRYQYSGLPFTPAANGVNDLAPVAPIQDIPLTELFISGMTSNVADFSYVQLLSQGATVGTRATSADLVARSNAIINTALDTDKIFLLQALQCAFTLGRAAHAYFNWGSSPSSTIRIGEYWLD